MKSKSSFIPSSFFIFDVESVWLHGEGFAVGGGVYLDNGAAQWEFRLACPMCSGDYDDLLWVKDNIPLMVVTHMTPKAMRDEFWQLWMKAKKEGCVMAADCGWPVEANFLRTCILENPARKWEGPYPFHEIATYLSVAGLDPLGKYDRTPSELPIHDPLADARQSARMLSIAIDKINN